MTAKRVIVFTVVHPGSISFVGDFVRSLNNQTFSNFSVLFLNDGVDRVETMVGHCKQPFDIQDVTGTPADIRAQGVRLLANTDVEVVVFCDSDDAQQADRVAASMAALERASLVCNDLDIVDQSLHHEIDAFWRGRLHDGFVFNQDFLLDKNIAGLGNTAVRGQLLKKTFVMPSQTPAPDWLLFTQLLEGSEGVFIHAGKTSYRQHEENTIGLRAPTRHRLDKVVEVKKFHYRTLQSAYPDREDFANQLASVDRIAAASPAEKESYLKLLHRAPLNYFWWEETNYWK